MISIVKTNKIYMLNILTNSKKHLFPHNLIKKRSTNDMNENAELIKYIDVAENVYERVYQNNQVSNNLIVNLNRIMAEIKNQAAEKKLKLKYSSIDFEYCLSLPLSDRDVKVDLSLVPHFEDREESILWLTNFVGKICEPKKMKRQKLNFR